MSALDDMFTSIQNIVVEDSHIIGMESDGSSDNYWIILNNTRYLMKDCSYNKRRKQDSYAPYCEYIASHFIEGFGLDVHETQLATWNNKVVVLCKDLFQGVTFKTFSNVSESSAGTEVESKEYTYNDVCYILNKLNPSMLNNFWDMFLMDAIIANRDRHGGNWGYIRKDNMINFSPLYDQGHSLLPDVNLDDWADEEFIRKRVYEIPGSQFKMWKEGINDRPMRTNFYEVINQSMSDPLFIDRLNKLRNKEHLLKNVLFSIDNKLIPKRFLIFSRIILYCRFQCLIMFRDFDEVVKEAYNLFMEKS